MTTSAVQSTAVQTVTTSAVQSTAVQTVTTPATQSTAVQTTTIDYHPSATITPGDDAIDIRYFGFAPVSTSGSYSSTLMKDIYRYNTSSGNANGAVMDIYPDTVVNQYIAVNFTVKGLGERYGYQNSDGSDGAPYYATLVGSTSGSYGGNYVRNSNSDSDYLQDSPCERVNINGDGTYTVI